MILHFYFLYLCITHNEIGSYIVSNLQFTFLLQNVILL